MILTTGYRYIGKNNNKKKTNKKQHFENNGSDIVSVNGLFLKW